MTQIIQNKILFAFALVFYTTQTYADPFPKEAFVIDKVKIGETTIEDVQSRYGESPVFKIRKTEDSANQVCYHNTSPDRQIFIIFESGPMGGFKSITGIRIAAGNAGERCTPTTINLSNASFGNGVRLYQDRKEFLEKFKISFKGSGEKLIYEGESTRKASKVELDKLREMWPNEKQTFFDVTTTIEARFKKNVLVDYYVSRIESY
jgi:hypothetical protein